MSKEMPQPGKLSSLHTANIANQKGAKGKGGGGQTTMDLVKQDKK